MGYAISVVFESIEKVNILLDFLEKSKDILDKLELTEQTYFKFSFDTGPNVSVYAPSKNHARMISMHGTTIPYYAWAVADWLAFQSSCRSKDGQPYLFYDARKIPLYIKTSEEVEIPSGHVIIDTNGIVCPQPRVQSSFITMALKCLNYGPDFKKQHNLLVQLNESWKLYMNASNSMSDSFSP